MKKIPLKKNKKALPPPALFPQKTSPASRKKSPPPPRKKAARPRLRPTPIPLAPDSHPFTLPTFLPQNSTPFTPAYEFLGHLPESYGTQRLFLTPRDPHTLFAYWDFTRAQIEQAEKEAADGKIYLQIFIPGQARLHQIEVSAGSREWFFPTHRPSTLFQAELGFYRANGSFHHLAVSSQVVTPPDSPSPPAQVQFVTIPFLFSFRQLWDLVRSLLRPDEALAHILARLQKAGHPLPFPFALRRFVTSATTALISSSLGGEWVKHHRFASTELTEILRRRLQSCPKLGSSQFRPNSPTTPPRPT